jgi:hypothetical protein
MGGGGTPDDLAGLALAKTRFRRRSRLPSANALHQLLVRVRSPLLLQVVRIAGRLRRGEALHADEDPEELAGVFR